MNNYQIIIICVIAMLLVVVLTTLAVTNIHNNHIENPDKKQVVSEGSEITERFIDEEAGTVCYVYKENTGYGGQGGLSCLPVEDTDLEPSEAGGRNE